MPKIFVIGHEQPLRDGYKPIVLGDISTVSMDIWAQHWRVHGAHWQDPKDPLFMNYAFGGSDIASVFGKSPWTSRLALWGEKTGVQKKKPFKNTDALDLGHLYETVTAQKYAALKRKAGDKHLRVFVEGKIVGTDGEWEKNPNGSFKENSFSMYQFRDGRKNPDGTFKYPYALADCDGFVEDDGILGGLEVKTTNNRNDEVIAEWEQGIIPVYYVYQIAWYLWVMNLQFWDIIVSWGQSFDDSVIIRYWRDYEFEDTMVTGVEEFSEYVEQGIEPDPSVDKGELLEKWYYQKFGPIDSAKPLIELPETFKYDAQKALELEQQKAKLKQDIKQIEADEAKIYSNFYPVMGNCGYAQVRVDDHTVVGITLKTPMKAARVDSERLEKDHPDVYAKCQKFDTVALGELDPKLKREYMLPKEPDTEDGSKVPSFSVKSFKRPVA